MTRQSSEKVLFVDDDEASTRTLVNSLKRRGADFILLTATSASEALRVLKSEHPEVAVVDLSLNPDEGPQSGLTLVSEIMALNSNTRVLVLTGHGGEEFGVKALNMGAASFVVKPVEASHILALIRDSLSVVRLKQSYQELAAAPNGAHGRVGLFGASSKMKSVIEAVAYASSISQPVLIVGETGTGKGVIAQAIHRAGPRVKDPLIRVQPTFTSNDLLTSEIFGHQRGAFTGAVESRKGLLEEAHKGTLFIDEVDELPKETQILLLNVLQERVFRRVGSNQEIRSDFRLITATNCPLEELVAKDRLREDFFQRIAHFVVELPPLRERKEDIPHLAQEFLQQIVSREKLAVFGFTPEAIGKLVQYNWPGNVRELLAVVEGGTYRANFATRRLIEPEDLQLRKKTAVRFNDGNFRERVKLFELQLVQDALARVNGNQSRAAENLGLDRTVLRRILNRQGTAANKQH